MAAKRELFGTDGIRGEANVHPMTPEVALRAGMAIASHFGNHGRVVVGKDTRLSGYMIETALASGLCAMGADVMLVGPIPTPGIAYITRSMRADAGIVVSASHNPFQDNGIKVFAGDGFKLPDEAELSLEAMMADPKLGSSGVRGDAIGKAVRIDDANGRYITHLKHSFPSDLTLEGVRIVVDCAHGAAYKIAPAVLAELGATVIPIGVKPDGLNINRGVGALHPENVASAVTEHGADLGIALDGDADRVVFADANGRVVDGDALLAIAALDMAERGILKGGAVVATILSNLGLERCLGDRGIALHRTPVGDRYVVEAMRQKGCNIGGEQSGHVIFLDHATTGDGIAVALQVLSVLLRQQRSLADLAKVMTRYPQVAKNLNVVKKLPLEQLTKFQAAIEATRNELGSEGRVVVRYSGTESKLRVMIEGADQVSIETMADRLIDIASTELEPA